MSKVYALMTAQKGCEVPFVPYVRSLYSSYDKACVAYKELRDSLRMEVEQDNCVYTGFVPLENLDRYDTQRMRVVDGCPIFYLDDGYEESYYWIREWNVQ